MLAAAQQLAGHRAKQRLVLAQRDVRSWQPLVKLQSTNNSTTAQPSTHAHTLQSRLLHHCSMAGHLHGGYLSSVLQFVTTKFSGRCASCC
jgi:hypothetical protein